MSQKSLMTETELHSTHDLIEFFQSRVDGIHSSTRQSYHKALATFETFLTNRSVDPAHISDNLLDDWLVDMCLRGMTFKTASHYFDIMASMYNAAANEGLFADSSLFKHLKEKLKSLPPTSWAVAVTDAEFKRMENVTRSATYQTGDIAKIESDHSENIIYRIKFGTQNGFKWDFGVDARITRAGTTS